MIPDFATYIAQADAYETSELLEVVLSRYKELNPDWDISILSLQKNADINEQIDRTIALLQNLKNRPKTSDY